MRIAIITLIIISAGAIGFFGERFYRTKITNDFVQEASNKKELLKTAENIWELWRKGLSSRVYEKYKDHCPAKLYPDDKCNKDLISCYLSKNQESGFEIDEINRSLYGGLSPREGLRVLLSRGSSSLSLILDKSCSKIYLPQRIYGFGEKLNPGWSERFDNFKRHIFIDKNLIPAKGMKYTQMKKFCENRGMQLLESHILDAAVFHPVDMRNTRPINFLNPKLPWTRKFKSTFIDKAQKNKNFKFDEKYCDYLYSKECRGMINKSLPSWMGLRNPLGGPIEVVRNINEASQKLVPSSFYYKVSSPWHMLGQRSSWTGESFDEKDYKIRPSGINDFSKLETGFRCMQEEWLE